MSLAHKKRKQLTLRARMISISQAWLTRAVASLTYNKRCKHGNEVWYCDGCKFQWEKRVKRVREGLKSKLKQESGR